MIIIAGSQGSGKGTQANLLLKVLGPDWRTESTGELLAEAAKTDPGIKAAKAEGHLVPDETVEALLSDAWDKIPNKNHLVLDGYPRNGAQDAKFLKMLVERGASLEAILILEISLNTAIARMKHRLEEARAKGLPVREDDANPEAVERRLNIYVKETIPALEQIPELQRSLGMTAAKIYRINAENPIDIVFSDVVRDLGRSRETDPVEDAA